MTMSELPAAMRRGRKSKTKVTNFVADFFAAEIRAWHGEQPLWKVFWIYGVATSASNVVLYVTAFSNGRIALQQVILPCFAAYTAWLLVSVWRCASKPEEKTWGMLARYLTVAWAANTILVLTFLQLNLLIEYLKY